MDWIQITKFVLTSLVIGACAYDILVIQVVGDKASISYWCSSFRTYPTVVFCCGWLCCHFFGVIEKAPPAEGMMRAERPESFMLKMLHGFGWEVGIGLFVALMGVVIAACLMWEER